MKNIKCRVAALAVTSILLLANVVPNRLIALDLADFPQASTTVQDDLDFNSPFELAKHFHIFSNEVSNTVHVNGNLATKYLKESRNFGTEIKNESTHVPLDLFYIQNLDRIASSSFVKQTAQRKNKVVFGSNVGLSLVDNNTAAAVAGSKLDNLKLDEIYQDKAGQVYIDFEEVFSGLREQSDEFYVQEETAGIKIDTSDPNRRTIDVSDIALDYTVEQVVVLKKLDESGNPLKGASFDLYQGDANNPLDTDTKLNSTPYLSDDEGLIELQLTSGQYYFKEVEAPTGYLLDESLHGFTVDEPKESNTYVYVNVDASLLEANTPLYITGMTTDGPSFIFNVITGGETSLYIQSTIKLSIDGIERPNKETEYFLDAKLLWNFPNEVETIKIDRPFQGSVLATGAHVTTDANLDGSIIADKVTIGGESHRWEFQTTTIEEPIELTVINKVDTEVDPTETFPVETDPIETYPSDTDPAEPTMTEPTETSPTESEPTETDPTETEPSGTDPSETEPSETSPTDTETEEINPSETSTEVDPSLSEITPGIIEPSAPSESEVLPSNGQTAETSVTPESGISSEVDYGTKPGGAEAEITNPPLTGDLLPDWVKDLFVVVAIAFALGGIGFLIYEKRFDRKE